MALKKANLDIQESQSSVDALRMSDALAKK